MLNKMMGNNIKVAACTLDKMPWSFRYDENWQTAYLYDANGKPIGMLFKPYQKHLKQFQALSPLINFCQQLIFNLQNNFGSICYERYEIAHRLADLLKKTGAKVERYHDAPDVLKKAVAIVWTIDDIKDRRPDLTDEQAALILTQMQKHHDATIGINWDVIDCYAEALFPEEE